MTLSASEVTKLKRAQPSIEGILPMILERWSPRAFADRDVSPADLKRVFEAARWAPSSSNEQPWRYIVGVRNSETHSKIVSALVSFNQVWAPNAPVLILGTANTLFAKNGAANGYALHDLGAADVLITLQATALGLVTHQMGGFDHDIARKALEIPETFALGSVMALGYLGEPSSLTNEKLLAGEIAPRTRKPLNEMVFSAWDQPADLG